MNRLPTCVALVDCNNFFASCERMVDPALENVPVAVLSSNDGCIIARSEEVKQLGIPMGAPWFKWKKALEDAGVRIFSLNMPLYTETSARIMNLLKAHVPQIQVFSIDEAFLDLSGMEGYYNLESFLEDLRNDIRREIGIPVSIGVAPTKTLAKLANAIAKKQKTNYVEVLMDDKKRQTVLRNTPVEQVCGVGRRNAVRLRTMGINSAWDMASLNHSRVQNMRSVVEGRLILELQGKACSLVEEPPTEKKHIGSSRSFGNRLTELEELKGAFTFLLNLATNKLARQSSACKYIVLSAYVGKPRDAKRFKKRVEIRLPEHSYYPPTLLQAVLQAVPGLFQPGLSYYKAAVSLHELLPIDQVKVDLFSAPGQTRQEKLLETLKRLNKDKRTPQVDWLSFHAARDNRPWIPKCAHRSVSSMVSLTDEELHTARPWW